LCIGEEFGVSYGTWLGVHLKVIGFMIRLRQDLGQMHGIIKAFGSVTLDESPYKQRDSIWLCSDPGM